MPPATLTLIISLVEEAIKVEPQIQDALTKLFSKSDPTAADWAALRASISAKSYADFVPSSDLPKS